ncbi:hypothetical protein [Streptomyces sediminimaris]|uniref:hypothetical protein n=1 Tax=Streptomyces sediminimaris TaxID=3383721 RepID=UPI00399B6C4B
MNSSRTGGTARAVRGPWAALCAAVAVVLGPAAVTAPALDQANAAPTHHPVRAGRTQARVPPGTARRRTAGA